MMNAPPPWQLAVARIEGALPFLTPELGEMLALASLRRLWRRHVRDFPFETMGLEHNPGLEAGELARTWYGEERRDLLSWISRRGPPPLARAAQVALAAKGATESFSSTYEPADRALARLDALLPAANAAATLAEWIRQLRAEEVEFLEGGSEVYAVGGAVFSRFSSRGAAWAASLAAAMRPQLFSLGAAPLALAGIAPRAVFRAEPEASLPDLLDSALAAAAQDVADDLTRLHAALGLGRERLAELYASSRAPDAWRLICGLGPLTRAELARGLGTTKRTASMAVAALEKAGLAQLRASDHAVIATTQNSR